MKTKSREFENFDRTMHELIKVPHSEIKAALDAEKAAKKKSASPVRTKKNDKRIENSDRGE